MSAVIFKQLSPTEWDAEREPFDCASNDTAASRRLDFHIRLERDEYVIDVFDNNIADPDKAYLTTHTCDTFRRR